MRLFARLLLFLSAAVACGPSLPAQDAQRRQPQPPGWQDRINDVFGDLIGLVSYLPFYDVAGAWFGIDTAPKLLRGDDGRPTVTSIALPGHQGGIEFARFSPDGRRVLTSDARHDVRVFSLFRAGWRLQNQGAPDPLLAVLRGHSDQVTAIDLFPDAPAAIRFTNDLYRRAELLTGSRDGTARIWRLSTEAERQRLLPAPDAPVVREAHLVLPHGAPVLDAGYSPSGRWIATLGADGAAIVWDERGRPARRIADAEQGALAFAFAADDELGVLDAGGTLRVHRLDREQPPARARIGPGQEPPPTRLSIDGGVYVLQNEEGATWRVQFAATAMRLDGPRPPMADAAPRCELRDGAATLIVGDARHPLPALAGRTTGYRFDAAATRLLTYGDGDAVRIHEWLVRGPTGNLASVAIPFVVLWLVVAAVLFTLFFRFVNFRLFKHALQCVAGRFSDPKDQGEVSHFQALSAALSATVGLGNIAGVAVAVMIGGPGATFWMIVAGLLGMTLKFTECTLGQRFRTIDAAGNVSGGPMHYLEDGFRRLGLGAAGVPLAIVFSVFCIGGSLAGGNAFQVNQSLGILRGQVPFFDQYPWVYGLLMAAFAGIVIIGGIRSIARVADKIVPLMCGIYVLSALVVILLHLGDVPAAIARIFSSALTGDAVYGGAIGALIMGFRRAAFSNEAGVGSASIAHSAARTPYAVREGIVALLEPFIDTVVVCTMTALVIGITGVYNAPEHAEIIAAQNGAGLTAEAFRSVGAFRDWFPWLLMVAVVLFAYSTMISWSYYGERCATKLFGQKASLPFKLLFLAFTVLGSIVTATNVLEFGDLMILLMAFPNIIGLYVLAGFVRRDLADYEAKLRSGEIRPLR